MRPSAGRRPKACNAPRRRALAWFESTHRYIDKPFAQFVFSLLTNNMRINYPRLAKAAPALTRAVDDLAAGEPPGSNRPSPPPMLAPYRLRELVLPNRIALSPMCMYSATDGTVNDFHLVHLGSRAVGGAGLVLTEMTDVLPEGRISLHCAGMYWPEHVPAWERVVKFVHAHSNSKIGIQLAHAGRKSECGDMNPSSPSFVNSGADCGDCRANAPLIHLRSYDENRHVWKPVTLAS